MPYVIRYTGPGAYKDLETPTLTVRFPKNVPVIVRPPEAGGVLRFRDDPDFERVVPPDPEAITFADLEVIS